MRAKIVLIGLAIAALAPVAEAAVCRSTGSGGFADPVWDCGTPAQGDDVIISSGHTITRSGGEPTLSSLTVESGAIFFVDPMLDAGNLLIQSLLDVHGGGLVDNGDFIDNAGDMIPRGIPIEIAGPGAVIRSTNSSPSLRGVMTGDLTLVGSVTVEPGTNFEVRDVVLGDAVDVENGGNVAITGELEEQFSTTPPTWAQNANSVLELYDEPSSQISFESNIPNEVAFRGVGGYRLPWNWGPDSGVQFDSVRVEMATPSDVVMVSFANALVANNINIVQGVLSDDGYQINDNMGPLDLTNVGTLTIGPSGQLWIGYHDVYSDATAASATPSLIGNSQVTPRRGVRRERRLESNSATTSSKLPKFAAYDFDPASIVRFQGEYVSEISTAPAYGNLVVDFPSYAQFPGTIVVAHDLDFGPQPLTIDGNLWWGAGAAPDAHAAMDFATNGVELDVAGNVGPEPATAWNGGVLPSPTALGALTFGAANVTVGGDWLHASPTSPGTGLWTFNGDAPGSAGDGITLPVVPLPAVTLANASVTWNADPSAGFRIGGPSTLMGTLTGGKLILAGLSGDTVTTAGANFFADTLIELEVSRTIAADANIYVNAGIFTQGNWITNLGHVTIEGGTLNSFNDGDNWIQGAGSILVLNTLTSPAIDGVPLDAISAPNTVVYGGAGDQVIAATNPGFGPLVASYYHLTLQGGGLRTAAAAISTAGTLTVGPSVLFQPATSVDANGPFTILGGGSVADAGSNISVAGDWTNGGTYVPGGGSVRFDGAIAQNVGATSFSNVAFANSAGVTLTGDIGASVLSIEPGMSLSAGANTITVTSFWSNSGTFNPGTGVVIINSSDMATVSGNNSFNELRFQGFDSEIQGSNTIAGAFVIESGAGVLSSSGVQTLLGNFINDGSFNGQATVAAGRRLRGTSMQPASAAGSTVTFAGPGPQSISGTGSTTFYHLDINNASGVTQFSPLVSVVSELLLTNGIYSANGPNVIHVWGTAPVTRSGGWVAGNLRKDVMAPATVLFEVGNSIGYGPLTVTTSSGSGSITVGGHGGSHPSAANGALAATRWWNVDGAGFSGNDVTVQWNPGDVQGDETKYRAARWDGVSWTTYPTVNLSTRTATISGLASFSDFTVGEPNAFTPAVSLSITSTETAVSAGDSVPIAITAYDSGGSPAIGYDGDMTITFSGPANAPDGTQPVVLDKNGAAVAMGTATTLTFSAGVANTTMQLFAVESPAQVHGTDGSLSTSTPLEIDVAPGATSAFAWNVGASQVVGEVFASGTLSALDSWDNVNVFFDASSNPVSLSANAPLSGSVLTGGSSSLLSGTGDFVSGVADLEALGIHYEGSTGTGTLTATASSTATGTSGSVTFSAGPATQLIVVAPGETFTPGVAPGKSGVPTDRVSGAAFNVTVRALDAFWNQSSSSDTIALSLSDTVSTPPASQAMTNGSATFAVTLLTAGSQTITATDVSNIEVSAGTATVFVAAGATHRLEIQLSSSSAALRSNATLAGQIAGVPFDIIVFAYDENGNVVDDATDVITFSSSDPQATLPPDTALSFGSMSGAVTLRTAGVPTVTASSATDPGVLPGVASVPVSPGALEGFVIEAEGGGAIPTQTAGQSFVVRITAVDCCGNQVSSFNGAVSVSADGALATGSGLTSNFVNGSTLHAVEFSDAGIYQLFVAASTGETGQSDPIEVSSGCPDAPALQSPANGATGVSSPVKFFWYASPGAEKYRLWVSDNGAPFEMVVETEDQLFDLALEGEIEWYVEAVATDCPVATSGVHFFTTEAVCRAVESPLPSVVGTVLSGESYDVLWDEVEGASRFHLQQSTDELFVSDVENFTVEGQNLGFDHQVLESTAFYYRVAAITDCNGEESVFSPVIRVVVVPQPSPENEVWEVTVPFGNSTPVSQKIFVPGLETGEVEFIATTDQPWMMVSPDHGTIGPEGRELQVHSITSSLQVGANTGTVFIEYLNTAGSGPLHADNDNKKTTVPVSISLVTPVKPVPKTGGTSSNALIIPAVAHSSGVNSEWRSDVRITNTSGETIRYVINFRQSGTDATLEGKQTEIEIKPNQTVALDDVVRNWYGLGSLDDGVTGVLEIVPTSSSGGQTGDPLQLATVASSRTYNVTSNGTFGQYIPAVPFSSFIAKSAENERVSKLSLQQISETSTYRTNIGLVEGSGQPADVKLTFFNGEGDPVHSQNVSLKPGEQQQINRILASAGVTLEDGRMEVEVLSSSGRVTAYASTVDNRTGDPVLIPAVKLPLEPAETYVIPGVADLVNSLASWRTDLRVFNPSDAPVPTTVVFFPQNNSGTPVETQVVVPAGGVLQLNDLLRETFGLQNAGGAVHVESPVDTDLVVTARTYNQTADGTYGQFIPAVTASDARGLGDRAVQILQIEESERFRTNLGLVEVSGEPVEVEITVLDPSATTTPVRRVELSGSEFRQMNRIVSSLGLSNTYNTRIAIRVVGGAGRLAAYASVVDNRTQDPTYVPGQ